MVNVKHSERLSLINLLSDVNNCKLCTDELPHNPRPVFSVSTSARLLIIGQAPGAKVHESGVPWADLSGHRLRQWLNINESVFYDKTRVALMPMGFCYPGKGSSGDLPPRPECASQWHKRLLFEMPDVQLTLLIGLYAQRHYLSSCLDTLTDTVAGWREYLPQYFPLPHPSPRNNIWLKKNPWFEKEVLPNLQELTRIALA
ncbi:MAG: uracil-DNA glycosylase family protein [Pseudomonadales bacterium]|jgi:uracil-DNA glycosylase|nr:uracil-DNA glycosylase family protein [Pseudomonadales bacterium]